MQAPDKATVFDQSRPFPLHPKVDMKPARLVDVINMGPTVIRFPGSEDYVCEQAVLVFYTGMKDHHGSGKTVNVEQRFTLSLGKKAKLRALVEGWRGDSFTAADEAKFKTEGFDINKFYGKPCLLTTVHKTSASGKTRCEVLTVTKVPEEMKALVPRMEDIQYERNKWWEEEKVRVQEDTASWLRKNGAAIEDHGNSAPTPQPESDDDLPF